MNNITVIICCAGMGTRLGIGTTKTLVKVENKSLIHRQLELMSEIDDVRIVVGYQAEKVIQEVNKIRKDVMFAFNYEYKTTGEAESLSKALIGLNEYTVIIDGDILINESDFRKLLSFEGECIGICEINSDEPIYALINTDSIVNLNENYGTHEYSCIAKIKSDRLKKGSGSLYSLLTKLLPIPFIWVRTRDIDTPDDYDRMIEWYKNQKYGKGM